MQKKQTKCKSVVNGQLISVYNLCIFRNRFSLDMVHVGHMVCLLSCALDLLLWHHFTSFEPHHEKTNNLGF